MYARRIGDRELTFDFAEGLINDNLLVVDRETGSLWSQLHGKAIQGPMEGTPLTVVPSIQTTWSHWRELHPDTRVVIVENENGYPYLYRNRRPGTPRPKERPESHDTTSLGLGLAVEGDAVFLPFHELQRTETPVRISLGGHGVVVHYRGDAPTAWAEDEDGTLLPGVLAYEFGWLDFFPESRVFEHSD